ncbi:hypothetical protein KM043_006870 [Ampulex compressa]|nr:hypothetical protein KM043_006870 [Ampulex compressa]
MSSECEKPDISIRDLFYSPNSRIKTILGSAVQVVMGIRLTFREASKSGNVALMQRAPGHGSLISRIAELLFQPGRRAALTREKSIITKVDGDVGPIKIEMQNLRSLLRRSNAAAGRPIASRRNVKEKGEQVRLAVRGRTNSASFADATFSLFRARLVYGVSFGGSAYPWQKPAEPCQPLASGSEIRVYKATVCPESTYGYASSSEKRKDERNAALYRQGAAGHWCQDKADPRRVILFVDTALRESATTNRMPEIWD